MMVLDVGVKYVQSPIGWLKLQCGSQGITHLTLSEFKGNDRDFGGTLLNSAQAELELYFAGKLENFSVPLAPEGTEFQKKVWAELAKIKYGKTTSYGKIARDLQNPGSVRAVGKANGSNPIAIIIPCHRVIGSDGSLTGYAWGTDKKRWLLEHEGALSRAKQMNLGF